MNITRAILELRIDYAKYEKESPSDINGGGCMFFANTIVKLGFGIAVWGDDLEMDLYSGVFYVRM